MTDAKHKILIREAVQETLLALGLNVSEPDAVLAFQKDMHFLRSERLNKEKTSSGAWQHAVNLVVSGVGAAIILGIAEILKR